MTTEAHVHRWICEPFKNKDVAAECACGATRVFNGYDMEGEFERLRRSPMGVTTLSYGSQSK